MTDALIATRANDRLRSDVLNGLSQSQKRLPSKYFYDDAGSRLFDRITDLPEYYPTRTEIGIMHANAGAISKRCGSHCLLIELGAGSATKVRILLDRLVQPVGYLPVDVSGEHLRAAAASLAAVYPTLEITPIVADFTTQFAIPERPSRRRVVYFPGSTIGNFDPPQADALLRRIAHLLGEGGGLLLGVDLRKDAQILERAYNDATGVTAAFNRNLLVRINRELGADFDVQAFRHFAFYNREESRIEMHLVSDSEQQATIGSTTFNFRAGESIHTENSYKYDVDELAARAAACGLRLDDSWTDVRSYFAVLHFTATPEA